MAAQEIDRLTSLLNQRTSENTLLSTKLQDLDNMNRTIYSLQDKIQRLSGENVSLGDEVKNAQESLRLSASKATSDINQFQNRLRDAESRIGSLTHELDTKNRELRQLH
jgi:chromosome segregation ATPase